MMQSARQDFAETYRNLSDDELASLHAQMSSLTHEARSALQEQIQKRGISTAKLRHLNTAERQREAKFDRLQKDHEKSVVSEILRSRYFWYVVLSLISAIAAGFGVQLSQNH